MKWLARFLILPPLALLFGLLWTIRDQLLFERSLNSLFITFADFTPDYSQALLKATADEATLYYNFPSLPTSDPASLHIPPIIHFIWYKDLYETDPDRTTIPSEGSNTPELCEKYNSNYTINIWNATAGRALLEKEYGWFLPTYDGYRYPIQRVDALKYFLLWHYGGVYLDMDVSCRRALNPLLEYPAWFPRASPIGVNNDVLASRARHPLIWKMISSLKGRNKNLLSPWITIFWTTGPRFTSDMLKIWLYEQQAAGNGAQKWRKKDPHPDAFFVLPQTFYSEEYTFFGHRPGGSWYGDDVAVVLWIGSRPWILAIPATACIIVFLYSRRKKKGSWARPSRTSLG